MKKLFLITVMFLSVVTLAQAQRGSDERPSQSGEGQRPKFNPEQMIQRQLENIDKAVTLTDAQKVKVKEILQQSSEARRKQFESMRESGEQPDHEKMRAMMDAARQKENTAIKALLSKEQLPKYDTYQKEMEAKMKERMKNGPQRGNQ